MCTKNESMPTTKGPKEILLYEKLIFISKSFYTISIYDFVLKIIWHSAETKLSCFCGETKWSFDFSCYCINLSHKRASKKIYSLWSIILVVVFVLELKPWQVLWIGGSINAVIRLPFHLSLTHCVRSSTTLDTSWSFFWVAYSLHYLNKYMCSYMWRVLPKKS
jgi:hypothetical protein